ncbi:hypothetical protein B0H10DRAFT_1956243 [Mycena sp. CBHHK59/15]|nr:hypothetical protein B0H10DRAFT_1956243 [Mycena sp. CBHHK59/15]
MIAVMFPDPAAAPTLLLVGHSMGGVVVVRACSPKLRKFGKLHQTVSTFATRGKPAHRGIKEGVGCGRSSKSGFVHEYQYHRQSLMLSLSPSGSPGPAATVGSTQIGLDGQAGWDGARWDLVHEHSDADQRGKTDTARYKGLDWYLSLRYYSCVVYIQELAPPLEATMVHRQDTLFRAMTMSAGLNDVVVIYSSLQQSTPRSCSCTSAQAWCTHLHSTQAWVTSGASHWSAAPLVEWGLAVEQSPTQSLTHLLIYSVGHVHRIDAARAAQPCVHLWHLLGELVATYSARHGCSLRSTGMTTAYRACRARCQRATTPCPPRGSTSRRCQCSMPPAREGSMPLKGQGQGRYALSDNGLYLGSMASAAGRPGGLTAGVLSACRASTANTCEQLSCERRQAGDVCRDGVHRRKGRGQGVCLIMMATNPSQIAYGLTQILPNLGCTIGFGQKWSAMETLLHMHNLLNAHPNGFDSPKAAMEWQCSSLPLIIKTKMIRNANSARLSVLAVVVPTATPSPTAPCSGVGSLASLVQRAPHTSSCSPSTAALRKNSPCANLPTLGPSLCAEPLILPIQPPVTNISVTINWCRLIGPLNIYASIFLPAGFLVLEGLAARVECDEVCAVLCGYCLQSVILIEPNSANLAELDWIQERGFS